MVTFRKMTKQDVPALYKMAMGAFGPDYERYGTYPPLLNTIGENFRPPLMFGRVVIADGLEIGGVFVMTMGRKGEIGTIFIDPTYQKRGYGRQVMLAIEALYPKVQKWKLDTPSENYHLHSFYESLGYVKTGEQADKGSSMVSYLYEKAI